MALTVAPIYLLVLAVAAVLIVAAVLFHHLRS